MHRRPPHPDTLAPARPRGFTLIELLVVISIIGLLVGLSFPYLRGMLRSSQEQMAANTISNAVQAARAYSTRYRPFVDPYQGRTAETDGDGYSGAAVVVTPANELRVSENDELAELNGRRLEIPPFGSIIYNGYRPIEDLDDLLIPRGVTVLGMIRTGDDEITLLPPPFAIAFSRRGELMTQGIEVTDSTLLRSIGANKRADGFVYYNGDGDDNYDINDDRQNFYSNDGTLEDFRRGVAPKIELGTDPKYPDMEGRYVVPFEKLEAVIGIVILQTDRVPSRFTIESDDPADINADPNTAGMGMFHPQRAAPIVIDLDQDNNLLEWASSPGGGQVLFFNRRTGAELRR